jgi:C1A family cysteine protease
MRRAAILFGVLSLLAISPTPSRAAPSLPKLPSAAEAEAAAKKAAEEAKTIDPKAVVDEAEKAAKKLADDKGLKKVLAALGSKVTLPATTVRAKPPKIVLPTLDEIARAYERQEKKAPKKLRADLEKLRSQLAKTDPELKVGMTNVRLDPSLAVSGLRRRAKTKKARASLEKLTADSLDRVRKHRDAEKKKAAAAPAPPPPKGKKLGNTTNAALPMGDLSRKCKASAKRWSWLAAMNPIDHQGSCGTCWAFATTSAFEASHRIFNDAAYDFSEQWVHDCHRNGGAGCNQGGAWPIEAMQSMMKVGTGFASAVPYTQQNNRCDAHPQSYYRAAAAGTVGDTWWWQEDPPAVDDLKEALCEHGPLVVEIYVGDLANWENTFSSYVGGVYTTQYTDEPHAVTLLGWDDDKRAWLIRNSWGTGWGIAGHMWARYGASDVGRNASWVAAAPGELGGDPAGGWFVQREIKINNATGGDITIKLSYDAWVGEDGWRNFPGEDYGQSSFKYTIGPTDKAGTPLADTKGNVLRAGRVKISARAADGRKWSQKTHTFEEAYRAKRAKPYVITFGP